MKFRDPKTGKVFDTIDALNHQYCSTINDCDDCPIFSANNRTGELCNCFCLNYPAEAARLMGYEVIEDEKEVNMEKKDKPRLAEVLGVEVGERFKMGRFPELVYITEDGDLVSTASGAICSKWMTDAINHPESIIRAPRLTEPELAICKILGARWVTRDNSLCPDVSLWAEKPVKRDHMYGGEATNLAIVRETLFPSVGPGDCIEAEEAGGA